MSNKLEQLRSMTTVVADTGDIAAIKRFTPQDATTNPSLLLKAAQLPHYAGLVSDACKEAGISRSASSEQLAACCDKLAVSIGSEIIATIPGRVSTEVDARLSFDTRASSERARHLIGMYEAAGIDRSRILIKLAYLISPYVGRILDWYKANTELNIQSPADDPGVQSVKRIFNYYKQHDYKTVVMGASFRNTGEIEELAGCDRLTISPGLLEELAADTGELPRKLDPAHASSEDPRSAPTEAEFRYAVNRDPMATEKLAEGIRNFVADQEKLETLLLAFDDKVA